MDIKWIASDHDARGVADYLIRRGLGVPQGGYTPLSVIKLTYLCHGWMLGLYARALFAQPVEAWKYGPVIPDVYHRVKKFGNEPIVAALGCATPDFDSFEKNLIDQVLDVYSDFSGVELSTLTHQPDTPWHMVWHKKGRNALIPNNLILMHFSELAKNDA